MKKSLLLAVAFGLALSACTKKNEAVPGANLDAKRQSDQGTEAKPKAVIAPNPEKPLVGSWQSPCVKEEKYIQTNAQTMDRYDSYRSFLTIEDGVMTEEFFRFKGVFCDPNYEHRAVRMGLPTYGNTASLKKANKTAKNSSWISCTLALDTRSLRPVKSNTRLRKSKASQRKLSVSKANKLFTLAVLTNGDWLS